MLTLKYTYGLKWCFCLVFLQWIGINYEVKEEEEDDHIFVDFLGTYMARLFTFQL